MTRKLTARQKLARDIQNLIASNGGKAVLRDRGSIPVVFAEIDGERHHIRIIDVNGREHAHLDEAES